MGVGGAAGPQPACVGWDSGAQASSMQRKEGVLDEAEDPAGFIVDSSPSLALSSPRPATPRPVPAHSQSQPSDPKFDVAAACTFQVAPQRLRLADFRLQGLGPFPLPSPPSPHLLPHPPLAAKTLLPSPAL